MLRLINAHLFTAVKCSLFLLCQPHCNQRHYASEVKRLCKCMSIGFADACPH